MSQGHGVSVTAAETARWLAKRGHKVTIGCTELSNEFPGLDVRIVRPNASDISSLARTIQADTVVALSAPYFDILPALPTDLLRLAWEAGDPTPALFPAAEAQFRKDLALAKKVRVYPKVDGVMTVSEFLLSDIGWPDAAVVPNGADHAGHYDMARQRADGPLRIGLLARLGSGEARYKGFDLAGPLLAELRSRNVDAVIELMGRGTASDATKLRTQGFKIHLNSTDDERAEFLYDIDVFISLSLWEGFDLPVVEAQWLGTPAIALDTGAHPEVTPLVVPDLTGLADLLESYARDADLLIDHGQLCRSFVAMRFTWEATAGRYLLMRSRFHAAKHERTEKTAKREGLTPGTPADRQAYRQWLACYGSLTAQDLDIIRNDCVALPTRPLVSILIDVSVGSQADAAYLFSSLLGQVYSTWEVLLFGSPLDVTVPTAAHSLCDDRLRHRTTFNSFEAALSSANGEWVMCLDNGSALTEHALYLLIAKAIRNHDLNVVYADEDRIHADRTRSDPVFKSTIDPDLLVACDAVGRGAIWRTNLLRQEAASNPCREPAAILHAAALEVLRKCGPQAFAHVPFVLHHIGTSQRPIHLQDLEKNAARHAERCRDVIYFEPNPLVPGTLHVSHNLPDPAPLVSVIIPTRDHADLLSVCIEGLLQRTDYPSIEIIIVDNGSTSTETLDLLERLSADDRIRILSSPGPFNYSKLVNAGVAMAGGTVVALLNDDIEVIGPGWLTEMVTLAVRRDVGAVGAKLLYPDGRVQHAGVVLGVGWPGGVAGHMHAGTEPDDVRQQRLLGITRSVSAVTGACLVVRKKLYQEIQGFDEKHLAIDFNDVDFCLRLREQKLRNVWTPFAVLYHKESVSRGRIRSYEQEDRFRREAQYMRARWGSLLDDDPYWNPNLNLKTVDFMLANPPRSRKPWDSAEDLRIGNKGEPRSITTPHQ